MAVESSTEPGSTRSQTQTNENNSSSTFSEENRILSDVFRNQPQTQNHRMHRNSLDGPKENKIPSSVLTTDIHETIPETEMTPTELSVPETPSDVGTQKQSILPSTNNQELTDTAFMSGPSSTNHINISGFNTSRRSTQNSVKSSNSTDDNKPTTSILDTLAEAAPTDLIKETTIYPSAKLIPIIPQEVRYQRAIVRNFKNGRRRIFITAKSSVINGKNNESLVDSGYISKKNNSGNSSSEYDSSIESEATTKCKKTKKGKAFEKFNKSVFKWLQNNNISKEQMVSLKKLLQQNNFKLIQNSVSKTSYLRSHALILDTITKYGKKNVIIKANSPIKSTIPHEPILADTSFETIKSEIENISFTRSNIISDKSETDTIIHNSTVLSPEIEMLLLSDRDKQVLTIDPKREGYESDFEQVHTADLKDLSFTESSNTSLSTIVESHLSGSTVFEPNLESIVEAPNRRISEISNISDITERSNIDFDSSIQIFDKSNGGLECIAEDIPLSVTISLHNDNEAHPRIKRERATSLNNPNTEDTPVSKIAHSSNDDTKLKPQSKGSISSINTEVLTETGSLTDVETAMTAAIVEASGSKSEETKIEQKAVDTVKIDSPKEAGLQKKSSKPISKSTNRKSKAKARGHFAESVKALKELPVKLYENMEESKYLDLLSLLPPITRFTLRELDFNEILGSAQLRHDLFFDPELQFKPNSDGEKGEVKKAAANTYWDSIETELADSHMYRIPLLIFEIRAIIMELIPQAQKEEIMHVIDVVLIEQELKHGALNPIMLVKYIGNLLKQNCAPARDHLVDSMISYCEEGKLVKSIRACYEVLESMKLDYANHQLGRIRPYVVDHAVEFEQRHFQELFRRERSALTATRHWIKANLPHNNLEKLHREALLNLIAKAHLIDSNEADSIQLPETLRMDLPRLIQHYNDWQDSTIMASLLVLYRQTTGPKCKPSDMMDMKHVLWVLLNDGETSMQHVILQMCESAGKVRGKPFEEREKKMVGGLVESTLQPGSQLYEVIRARVGKVLKNILNGEPNALSDLELTKVGLLEMKEQIKTLSDRISLLCTHNYKVFKDTYLAIVEGYGGLQKVEIEEAKNEFSSTKSDLDSDSSDSDSSDSD